MIATTEEDDEEIEDFLNKSEYLLNLHNGGYNISDTLRDLKLPRVRTPGVCHIYAQLKKLKQPEEEEEEERKIKIPPLEISRPSSPSEIHRCKCVHVVLPKKNEDPPLQAKDFLYLFICLTVGIVIYLYLYNPAYQQRQPIY